MRSSTRGHTSRVGVPGVTPSRQTGDSAVEALIPRTEGGYSFEVLTFRVPLSTGDSATNSIGVSYTVDVTYQHCVTEVIV